MFACFIDGPGRTVVRDVPVPSLESGDVLVRMKASGICGTDLEKIEGQLGPGGILGHEVSGTIEAVAKEVSGYNPGDRVVAHHHVPCYQCNFCIKGDFTMCSMFKSTNLDPCGFAEYFRVPEYNVTRGGLIPLPSRLSFDEGAMVEPTACCIRAIRKAQVRPDDNVLVVGLGPTGLTQLQLLRNTTSGKIIGTDVIESRLRMGRRLGADETINPITHDVEEVVKDLTTTGVDLAVVATGNEKALDQAFSNVRKGGRILLFGAPAQGATYRFDVSNLFANQVSVISSYSCVEAEMHEAILLTSEKKLTFQSMITDRFPTREMDRAFEHAKTSKTAVKTLVIS